jgi:hypothetical protein
MTPKTATIILVGCMLTAGGMVATYALTGHDPADPGQPGTVGASGSTGIGSAPGTPAGSAPTPTATTIPAAPTRITVRPTPTATRPRSTVKPTPTAAETTEPVTGAGYDNCAELRVDYPTGVPAAHPAYQKKFDPNNDGWACEIEPQSPTPQPLDGVVGGIVGILTPTSSAPAS